MLRGIVTEFSDERGLGTVTDDGGHTYVFHVIEIEDGTRTIGVGQSVGFEPLPRFGSLQAGRVAGF